MTVRALLDTHALLWWLLDLAPLSPIARAAVGDADNEIFVSAVTAWEISIKYGQGKLPQAAALMTDLSRAIADEGFAELPVTVKNGEVAGILPLHHRDPFDRMLIAQALAGSLTIVSNEQLFDRYGVARLW
jgi:PIN domain nuclease of toxin-antitoxin system